jgi:hypothetical protein
MGLPMAACTEGCQVVRIETQRILQRTERLDVMAISRDRDATLSLTHTAEDILRLAQEPRPQTLVILIVASLGS